MTCLSVATWMGRPGATIGASAEPDSLRALASIEASSSGAPEATLQMVQLSLSCADMPGVIHVAQHQHQVQFQLHHCAVPDGSVEIMGSYFSEPLMVFPADREGLLDSEIVQLKEGANTFTLEWMDRTGTLRSTEFQIQRG